MVGQDEEMDGRDALDLGVPKKEKETWGADDARLRERKRRGVAWVPKGKERMATWGLGIGAMAIVRSSGP